jgi:threonylcarbamoyladenosine tRNA methylthiotransferase MtaB
MKVFLNSIGCRLNQSEIEKMANQFLAAGHELVDLAEDADLVVVNTCTVTGQAAADSRRLLRLAMRTSKARIIATGCWATLEPESVASLSGLVEVVTNQEKEHLVPRALNLSDQKTKLDLIGRQPLPGTRHRTRAFIKIQDGCDSHCTFCVTRIARGPACSRPASDILKDIFSAVDGGALEVVLTGVQISSWGKDFNPPLHLHHLIEKILLDTPVARLRLSSIEPWDLDNNFFSLWQDKRLCRHLHLPLQSGSPGVLQRMARRITPESFSRLVEAARLVSPDMAITTDIIVGFPGESNQEFEQGLSFIEQQVFSGGHVFNFSARPLTLAARLPQQVPSAVRKERSARLRALFANLSFQYSTRFTGAQLQVLWESAQQAAPQSWYMEGLTDNYLRVGAFATENLWNKINLVSLQEINRNNIRGIII